MDLGSKIALVVGLFSLTFMLNVPFGFLRSKTNKFSIWWFLCIHATIPIIFLGRFFAHLGVVYVPFFIIAAVLGQVAGGRLRL